MKGRKKGYSWKGGRGEKGLHARTHVERYLHSITHTHIHTHTRAASVSHANCRAAAAPAALILTNGGEHRRFLKVRLVAHRIDQCNTVIPSSFLFFFFFSLGATISAACRKVAFFANARENARLDGRSYAAVAIIARDILGQYCHIAVAIIAGRERGSPSNRTFAKIAARNTHTGYSKRCFPDPREYTSVSLSGKIVGITPHPLSSKLNKE